MTRPLMFTVSAAAALLCATASVHAQVTLSLESGGVDLSQLRVGDTATIEVRLSGLQPGQELDALSATVIYDSVLLGDPAIAAGAILPNPLADPFDFLVWEGPGIAEGAFLTMGTESSDHVLSHGTFFSFDFTVLGVGTGSFAFDFVEASEFNPADPFDPISLSPSIGPPLPFIVVPEPAGLSIIVLLLPFVLVPRVHRPVCRKQQRLTQGHTRPVDCRE